MKMKTALLGAACAFAYGPGRNGRTWQPMAR